MARDYKAEAQRYYDALRVITFYVTPKQASKEAERVGLERDEFIEMAYENMRDTAVAAIKGKRRPT